MKINKKVVAVILLLGVLGILAKFVFQKNDFLYLGTVEATKIDLSPRVSSVISFMEAREGMKVQEGQVLVKLAGEDFKLYAEIAESDFLRSQKLVKSGSISQEAFDHIRFKRDESKMKFDWTEIKAPVNGTVLNTYREAGEWASPGIKLLTVANLQEVWAIVYVAQPMLAKLSLGMKVNGAVPEIKDQKFSGKIVRIADEAEFTPKNVQTRAERTRLVYGIKVAFENKAEFLKPGMSVEVKLPE